MKIGILGAGQLARMMILESKALGFDFSLFAEKMTSTTKDLAFHELAPVSDREALARFCESVDVVTFESENYDAETLDFVSERAQLFPPKEALLVAQDRLKEKTLAKSLEIPTNNFVTVDTFKDLKKAGEDLGFPLILKKRSFGYDGKFQFHLKNQEELLKLEEENLKGFLAESFVPFDREVSIIGVRHQSGDLAYYDLCENIHEKGVLRKTKNIKEDPLFEQAKAYHKKVSEHFHYVGVLAIEFFALGDQLLLNEMAPRVHNTGHWTIEGSLVSQFANHIRGVAGLPLGGTGSLACCEMKNCLGEMPDRGEVLLQGGSFHDYQKEPRPGRKLGHVTYTNLA